MGRPLLDPSLRKNWSHTVNFYESEYSDISSAALSKGKAIAKWLREAALEKMAREKETADAIS